MATIAAQVEQSASARNPARTDETHLRIRPLGLAGALDQAVLLLRDHLGPLLKTALLIAVVPRFIAFYIGQGGMEEAVRPLNVPGQGGPDDLWNVFQHFAVVTVPLYFVCNRIMEPLALGALVYQSAAILHGQQAGVGASIRHSLRRLFPLAIAWGLRWLCIFVGFNFCCIIPGILLAGLFIVALPAIVLEGIGPFAGLGRSIDLTKGRFLPAVGLAVVLSVVEYNVLALSQFVPVSAATAVAHALLYAAVLPLYAAAVTTFYFAGRCLTENYDLEVLAAAVASGPIDETAPESSPYISPRERWSPDAAAHDVPGASEPIPEPPAADDATEPTAGE